MTTPLEDGYRAEFDVMDDDAWYKVVASFRDANIYQLWHCGGAPRWFAGTSRSILLRGGEVVAATEARLFEAPLSHRGIAYVRWGPLWRRTDRAADVNVFRQAVRALKAEYVARRQMILRVNPGLCGEDSADLSQVLLDEGLDAVSVPPASKTLLVDISPEVEELRRRLDKKWRNCLSKAEKSQLSIAGGRSPELFDEFATIYRDMLARKRFAPTADLEAHRRLQTILPDALRMQIVIARINGVSSAGAIYSSLGEMGTYLFGATNELGLRACASYLVQWEILRQLKSNGVRTYDLNGINALANPGTYHFKKGLAGSHGREVLLLSQVQAHEPSLTNGLLLSVERFRRMFKDRRQAFARASAFLLCSASWPL